jgi:adenylate kinase family enzyme
MTKIICLAGYKGSGKDTVANYISTKYNYQHKKIATPLKNALKLLFDLSDSDLEENKEKNNEMWDITPRTLMKWLGTDVFQFKIQELFPTIGKTFWIKKFINTLRSTHNITGEELIVVSDLRFIHEYTELIKVFPNMIVIKINNNNVIKDETHASETEYNSIKENYLIDNSGNLCELYEKIDHIINEVS